MTTFADTPIFQPAAEHPALHAGEVHLWLATLGPFACEEPPVLTADEWLRAERFHHAVDRHRYIASRTALRTILARYASAPPGALRFLRGEYGKPHLAGSLLRFNLSHSEDAMLLAVTHRREVGVDLEFVRENLSFEMLSEHYFTPDDQWQLRITPESKRRAKFFELWTRAEAQIKARGLGLSDALRFDDADRFTLHSFMPAPGFAAALAVEGSDFEVSCWRCLS